MRVNLTSPFTNKVNKFLHGFGKNILPIFTHIMQWGHSLPVLDVRPLLWVLAPTTLRRQAHTPEKLKKNFSD